MQDTFSLNVLYKNYTSGLIERKEFEGLLFRIILDDLDRFNPYRWKRDECCDYVSWLYPRLRRAIESYRDSGSSFESYISSIVRWSAKEYRAMMINHQVIEYAAWSARVPDMYAGNAEPEYPEIKNETAAPVKRAKNPRQLLILILKCYYYLSDDFIERAAPAVGLKSSELKLIMEKLRKQRLLHDDRVRSLRERIYCQFYRCIILEKQLKAAPVDSTPAIKLKTRLERSRIRLEKMRKRLARIRVYASNLEIAKTLGIPKGTIDSNLHALKSRWNIDPKKIILN
jgi:DNA-directed RNA polymerase specialized sigma24 family protein